MEPVPTLPPQPDRPPLPDSAEAAREDQRRTNERVASATGILALGNIASRVLGLGREILLTYLFGASMAVDAFQIAIIAPKALYDLLIGGHVNGAIVPVLSEVVTVRGLDELWRVVSILLTAILALMAALVLALVLAAPTVVSLVAGGADASTQMLATDLLRLTTPALLFMGAFALLSGTLFALRRFTWPAFASAVFNGTIVVLTLAFAPPLQWTIAATPGGMLMPVQTRPAEGIVVVALAWVVGAIAQMLLQLPGLRGARLRLQFNWRHPALRSIALLYAPVMFSLMMDTLIIRPFSYNLASQTGEGSIATMNWATTLVQFPQGLVASAISLAILPTLAIQVAVLTAAGRQAFRDTLGLGLRLATTLMLPAAVGLFVLAVPIVQLLFEHGAFTPEDTTRTVLALRLYLVGLPFAAIDLLLVYAFYARKDTLTPALIGVVSLAVYMVIALLLIDRFGLFSLMIADTIKHIVHAGLAALLLGPAIGGFGGQKLASTVGKTALASLAMAGVGWLVLPVLAGLTGGGTLLREAALVLLSGAITGGVFLALAAALRIDEVGWIVGMLRARLGGSRS
jgi:putative peptidoglycan lipid II flippase